MEQAPAEVHAGEERSFLNLPCSLEGNEPAEEITSQEELTQQHPFFLAHSGAESGGGEAAENAHQKEHHQAEAAFLGEENVPA